MIRSQEETSMLSSSEQRDAGGNREDRGQKKPYRKPQIEDYGSVVELTGTGDGTAEEGGVFEFSGGSG